MDIGNILKMQIQLSILVRVRELNELGAQWGHLYMKTDPGNAPSDSGNLKTGPGRPGPGRNVENRLFRVARRVRDVFHGSLDRIEML